MRITKKVLDYYNAHRPTPGYNEHYNKAHGMPSMKQWSFMNRVRYENFGIGGGKLTMKMIREGEEE